MRDGVELLADLLLAVGGRPDADRARAHALRPARRRTGCSTGSCTRSAGCRCWSRASAARSAPVASSRRSTSARTGSTPSTGSTRRRGTRAGSAWPGRATSGSCSGRSRARRATRLAAIVPTVTASQFHGAAYGGGLALESLASWHTMVAVQEKQLAGLHMLGRLARLRGAYDHLPLGELDVEVLGESSRLLPRGAGRRRRRRPLLGGAQPRATSARRGVGAADRRLARPLRCPGSSTTTSRCAAAGRDARLLVGPWTHTSRELWAVSTRESIRFLRARLLGDERLLRGPPVRVHVGGSDEWRDLRDWPPPRRRAAAAPARGRRARRRAPPAAGAPTPTATTPPTRRRRSADRCCSRAARGRQPRARAPRRRARLHERAAGARVEAIGPVRAEIFVRSTLEHFDVFVRVCDVDRLGVSRNVCDALERVTPARRARRGRRRAASASRCGRRRTASGAATASGCRSPAARTRATRATPGTGEPLVSATTLWPPTRRSSTIRARPSASGSTHATAAAWGGVRPVPGSPPVVPPRGVPAAGGRRGR